MLNLQVFIDSLMLRMGYTKTALIPPPAEQLFVPPLSNNAFREIGGGKVLFPIATNKAGKPIIFERNVAYIVGFNGHWRKKRVVSPDRVETEDTEDDIEDRVENSIPVVSVIEEPTVAAVKAVHKPPTEYRQTYSRIHARWSKLMASCYEVDHPDYKYVGAQGATVSERWKNYELFKKDLIGAGGAPFLKTLVRIDETRPFGEGNFKFVNLSRNLTDDEVREIRRSTETTTAAGLKYGISSDAVSKIRRYQVYKDID
ncbi:MULTISPECIES: hypothetical protein [unclassified Rhizobium]|uniref:hypothetical protein n=1 Tax=unclassified Rhizobium TaxID=2613769 RepID=UPI00115EF104|nr:MULTISPECIES: hypothetical protein [unclassified Rhizobium]TQX90239.1 hypothetical protein EQW76_11085 [Rhizobium sp. rho-13.1]TQY16189.1 hypothetical protein EQW74_10675 [Rhizobium sp. rho-1.1]